ncbi:hypothetical protein H0H93_002767, partial [Arthromyces matolae]
RGGAGNIHSPSRDPSSQRVNGGDIQDTHLSDAEVIRAHVANTIDLPVVEAQATSQHPDPVLVVLYQSYPPSQSYQY